MYFGRITRWRSLTGICRSTVYPCHENSPPSDPSGLGHQPRAQTDTMATSQDTTDILRNATFSHPDGPTPSVTAADLLLAGAYDPAKLHPMSGLSDNLDYLLLEDDKVNDLPGSGTAIPSRGWSDDLCYGTGTMYLTGPCLLPSFISHPFIPFIQFWSIVKPGPDSFRLFCIIHSHLINLIVLAFVTCSLVFPRARRRWYLGFA